jgi:hypothetical protein
VKQLARSLEMKWWATKHDISKFMGYHGFIIIFNESNTFAKDTLPKSLKLYI